MEPRQTRSSRLRDLPKASQPDSTPLATTESLAAHHEPPSRSPSPSAKRLCMDDDHPPPGVTYNPSSSAAYAPASPLTATSDTSSSTSANSPSTALTASSSPSIDTPSSPLSPPLVHQPNGAIQSTSSTDGSPAIATMYVNFRPLLYVSLLNPSPPIRFAFDLFDSTVTGNATIGMQSDDSGPVPVHTTPLAIKSEPVHPPPAVHGVDIRPASVEPTTSAPMTVPAHDDPTDTTYICQETGAVVCTAPDRLRAERVVVDSWVPVDTIERLRLLSDYSDHTAPAFSLARIPSTATWGDALPSSDVSGLLCIDNRPITAYVAGTVLKKWFTDYQGTLQSPVKVCIRPCRAIDLASANHWLSQSKPSTSINLDCFWATRLMLEWPEDLDVDKPELTAFKHIYDSTNPHNPHNDQHRKSSRFFDAGDVVLVEVLITRYKPKGTKSTGWSKYNVGYELKTIDVIARNPVRPNPNARPSLPTRSFNI